MDSRQEKEMLRIAKQYTSTNDRITLTGTLNQKIHLLLDHVGMESTLFAEFKHQLKHYIKANLNQIGIGDHFTIDQVIDPSSNNISSEKSTNQKRVFAVNTLFDMMKSSSVNEIYRYVTSPAFEHLAGLNEYHFNLMRIHLSKIIQHFTHQYKKFLDINNKDTLLDVLLDPTILTKISDFELGKLFWQYDATLIADIIVNVYKKKSFQCKGFPTKDTYIDYQLLSNFLDNDQKTIEIINQVKRMLYTDITLPPNSLSPGKNVTTEESLTPAQLYQYDEPTIFAVEQWLRDHYRQLLINKIEDQPVQLSNDAPLYFYQIPSALYMLIDPEQTANARYYRYKKFKNDLITLIHSHCPNKYTVDKPIIFFGIINLYNIHYLPYFIYKNKANKIQVLTVDPSARTYPDNESETESHKDGKLTTRKQLQKIFQDLLPNCQFSDADVNQMLRERDCGPNSGTTLLNALSTCLSNQPLLNIVDDQLIIDTRQLTINLTPVGINTYKGMFVYSKQLEELSLTNRAEWETRLKTIKQVAPLTIRSSQIPWDAPLSIHDTYQLKEQISLDYHYEELVEHQQQQDLREVNISAIHSLLLSKSDSKKKIIKQLVAEYEKTLSLPNPTNLINFVKENTTQDTLLSLTSAHQGNLLLLVQDVIIMILRDRIPDTIIQSFKLTILDSLVASPDLNANKLVEDFLYKFNNLFKKLSNYQQIAIKKDLLTIAEEAIKIKLIYFYLDIIQQVFIKNCRQYIADISSIEQNNIADIIYHKHLLTDEEYKTDQELIKKAYLYLKIHAQPELKDLIEYHVKQVMDKIINQTTEHIHLLLDLDNQSLDTLLSYISIANGKLIEWDITKLMRFLSTSTNKIITESELCSCIGKILIKHINLYLSDTIIKTTKTKVAEKVREFMAQQAIQDEFTINQSIQSLSNMLDKNGNILQHVLDDTYLEKLIQQFGSKGTITNYVYSHPLVKTFIYFSLREGINDIIRSSLYHEYAVLSQHILLTNFQSFEENTLITLNDAHQTAIQLYLIFLKNSTISHYFQKNLMHHINNQLIFNEYGERFHHWFITHKIQPLIHAFNKAKNLKENIETTINLLTTLYTQYQLPLKHVSSQIHAVIAHFTYLLQNLKNLSLCREEQNNFTTLNELNTQFMWHLGVISLTLLKAYKIGEITPGKLAIIIRPTLSCLLSIDTPTIITDDRHDELNAYQIDHLFKRKIQILSELNDHKVNSQTNLMILTPCKQLPDTYNQPITKNLLLNCISYWYVNRPIFHSGYHQFISALIQLVNSIPNSYNELTDVEVKKINTLLFYENTDDKFTIYASNDILNKIKAVLSKTTSITHIITTPLSFSAVNNILGGKTSATKKNDDTSVKKLMTEHEIQQKVLLHMRELRIPTEKTLEDGSTVITMELPKGVTLTSIRQQIINDNNENILLSNEQELARNLQNVKKQELQRTGLFPNIFGVTDIEKRLLTIQNKHNKQADFHLDSEDVIFLNQRLKERWKKLVNALGENQAATRYLISPNRKDKVYIAVAEILAKYYRSIDKKNLPCYHLLMPTYTKFPHPRQLRQYTLPTLICADLNIPQEKTSIDDITIKNLIITPTGYALDIDWIIHQYQREEKIINPYTIQDLTIEELDVICLHPRSTDFLKMVSAKCSPKLSSNSIELLVMYINNAIFTEGFSKDYNSRQNALAQEAFTNFRVALENLSQAERDALLNETIPGDSRTVQDIFISSQGKFTKKDGKISDIAGNNSCLTGQGVYLAKLVIAYKGNNHGIKNSELIKRARIDPIPPRVYKLTNTDMQTLSNLEMYLYKTFIRKKRTSLPLSY